MDRYIEVIGEGHFEETAARFLAEVTLEVRAAKEETALREVGDLREEALSVLRSAGIVDEEIVEGGLDVHRPWHWKKKVGQTATRKLLLKVEDFGRLSHALELLEPLQSRDKDRKTVSVQMRQPEFANESDGKATALIEAFTEARAKASRLLSLRLILPQKGIGDTRLACDGREALRCWNLCDEKRSRCPGRVCRRNRLLRR